MSDPILTPVARARLRTICGQTLTRHVVYRGEITALLDLLDQQEARIRELETERASERDISMNDPCEQRAERYALEAIDLTYRLMAAEAELAALRPRLPVQGPEEK